ncbi:MAG TPA: porin [Rhizomicrobium sp.]|jgi:phosphate-selective porin OprO/OprP
MKRILLLGAAATILAAAAPSAFAQDNDAVMKRLDQMQKQIEAQQKQIESQKKEIGGLNRALGRKGANVPMPAPEPVAAPAPAPAAPSPLVETRLQQQDQKIDDVIAKFAAEQDQRRIAMQEQPQASVNNGRLQIASADGRFSAALRLTAQYDLGYYMQGERARTLPLGADLSSGGNFRRAQIGLQGKVFGDWSYYVNIDYGSGGSTGTETPGHIQQAYVEYDGFGPFIFRVGAHPPSTGMDDSYAASDQLFMERSAPGDLARNMAGGDGRDSIEAVYQGDRLYGSLAYTGDKAQATGAFDEQQAVVARVAYSPVVNSDWRWVVSAAGTDVFKPTDGGSASSAARAFALSNPPELIVDDNSTKFVSVSDANVTDAWNWNLESAVTYQNVLAQAGYFKYGIDQRGVTTHRGQGFDGWYAEGSWVLTGESRGWSAANAAFTNPKPRVNFSSDGGSGAWEVAARYSTLDLNDNAGVVGAALPVGGVRGGEQRITTLGLNWYPNQVLKFTLQLQNTQVGHIGTNTVVTPNIPNANIGQNFQTVGFRSQIAF